MRIPAVGATSVALRLANILERDHFGEHWAYVPLTPGYDGFWEVDVNALRLADGTYEYELVLDDDRHAPVPDPYAKEITRFGGYRGLLHIRHGLEATPSFDWSDELPQGVSLADNNRIIIYEMPVRWMKGDVDRQVGLGTFDEIIFAHLARLAALGINCIELLPCLDSPDTLNWGYGTRFFFAPDYDMGEPIDLKLLVKRCHQRGIRVIMDMVMNHAKECPLARLAFRRFFLNSPADEPGRGDSYGADMFRYRDPIDGQHWARAFHLDVARYLIEEYHVDGFRLDEFKGIDHWEFIQQFRDHAWAVFRARFPDRPFIVIAEDSWTRPAVVHNDPGNPGGRKITDAMWSFSFRDELRRLMLNDIHTALGQPPRRERISSLLSGTRRWDDWNHAFAGGFADISEQVIYVTSHDVEKDGERRLMNHVLSSLLRFFQLGDGSFRQVHDIARRLHDPHANPPVGEMEAGLYRDGLERVRSAYALLLTAVGIPMLLAGEEFGDIHDTDHHDWRQKMSDPVDWRRYDHPDHRRLADAIGDLMWLRQGHPAMHRNEIAFFHFHPSIDENDGVRVFAYCRTAGKPLGEGGQVIVIANAGPANFAAYDILPWPWRSGWKERGRASFPGHMEASPGLKATLSLAPFEVRVFETY